MNHEPWEPWQPLSMSPLIGISLSILREKNLLGDSSGRSTHLEIPTRTHDFRVGFMPSELQLRLRARSEDLDGPCLARPRILVGVLPVTTYTTSNGGDSLNKKVFRRALVDLNNSKQHETEKKYEKQHIIMRIQATTLEILKHKPSLVSPCAQTHHICIFGRGKQKNNITQNMSNSLSLTAAFGDCAEHQIEDQNSRLERHRDIFSKWLFVICDINR